MGLVLNLNVILAYFLLTLGQIAIGVNVVAGKYLIDYMPVYSYLFIRFFTSALYLMILVGIMRESFVDERHPKGRLTKRDWTYLTLQALTGGFLFNALFYWGIQYTTAISAGIISSCLPAIIALCAFLILKEKLDRWKITGIALAMIGILIINWDNPKGSDRETGSFIGDFVVLLSMVPEALYSIFNKYTLKRVTPLGGAAIVNVLICLMLAPLGLEQWMTEGVGELTAHQWILLLMTGFASVFFFWFWSRGLMYVSASTAAIFTSVLPVSTTLMAWAFLKEQFGWYDGIGMIVVLSSIFIGTGFWRKKKKHESKTK